MSEDFFGRDRKENSDGDDGYSSEYGPKINFDAPLPPRRRRWGTVAIVLVAVILFAVLCGFVGMLATQNAPQSDTHAPAEGGDVEDNGVKNNIVIQMGDGSSPSMEKDFTTIVESCAASVVEIITTPYSGAAGTVSGAGSGVIIGMDESGTGSYIVTNNHVIEGNFTVITVRTVDGAEYTAEVIGVDWQSDIAVLRIEKTGLTVAKWFNGDNGKIALGQSVIAIGNPLGSLGGSVSRGIISGVERTITVESVPMKLIQIDAAINPGNSGGGLFDLNGELIGIVNAKSVATEVEGIGFAIPATHAIEVVKELCEKGYVSGRIDLGFRFSGSLEDSLARGLVVSSFAFADGAESIQANDVLISLQLSNGKTVSMNSMESYRNVLVNLKEGDMVKATIVRLQGYNYTKITVTLTARKIGGS